MKQPLQKETRRFPFAGLHFLMTDLSYFQEKKGYVQNLKAEIVVELVCVRDAEQPKVLKMFYIYLVRGNKFVLQNTCLLKQYSFIQYFQWGFGVVGFPPQNVLTYADVKH